MTIAETIRRIFGMAPPPKQDQRPEKQKLYDDIPRLAAALLQDATEIWAADPHRVTDAIIKAEQSWVLLPSPDAAIQLGVMYDRVNRHCDALSVYRQATHAFPHHARLRHETGITILRHGTAADAREFFESVLSIDPGDCFAVYFNILSGLYQQWIEELDREMQTPEGPCPYVIACPVWGETYARDFVRYLCASLLASGNLPGLACGRKVHFVVFTTEATRMQLETDSTFNRLRSCASIHFIVYPDELIDFSAPMKRAYGEELGPYYARTCKFLLMSSAHYVALTVARRHGGFAIPLGADAIFADGSFEAIGRHMDAGKDVILLMGIRLGDEVQPMIETFRTEDGLLAIPSPEVSRLYVEHIPDGYFAESDCFALMPIMLCWRVGDTGVLIHSNHYHPVCIRAAATEHPYELTIDPVDSRFMERAGFSCERVHLVLDDEIAGFGVESEPVIGQGDAQPNRMVARDVGLWLWGVWGELRPWYFRSQLRYSTTEIGGEWRPVEGRALAEVDEALATARAYDLTNRRYRSWTLGRPS